MKKNDMKVLKLLLSVLLLSIFLSACSGNEPANAAPSGPKHYTYVDIVDRLYDLKSLAVKPVPGENSDQFSSYDRRSSYSAERDQYNGWSANSDGTGVIRMQDDGGSVIAEMNGPGYITRIWSAETKSGHIKIYIDGNETPVIDVPFEDLAGSTKTFDYSQLSYTSAQGKNLYVPITYNKSCKVVVYTNWGRYYHVDYTTLPEGYTVESFKLPLTNEQTNALSKVQNFLATSLGTNPTIDENEDKTAKNTDIKPNSSAIILNSGKAGAVTGIRVKVNNLAEFEDWEALRELTISAYWDGTKDPQVWAPLGDFFGSAAGYNEFEALPMGMTKDGWMYSYWYMPYEKATIEIKNEGGKVRNLDYEISTVPLKKPIDNLMRFHAKWSRNTDINIASPLWPDSLVLDTTGQGRFLGMMLHVYKTDSKKDPVSGEGNWWWGEGDEKFFIDNEKFPSWYGTGTEDYFGYAWCDPTVFSKPFNSQPYNKGGVAAEGSKVVNRFQIIDNIPFQQSFKGFVEKYYRDEYVRRASVSYWYLDSKGTDNYKPVSLEERTNYYKYLPQAQSMNEGEDMFVESCDGGTADGQDMSSFGAGWSSKAQLWWHDGKVGNSLNLYVKTEKKGKYKVKANLTKARDYGIVQFYYNGNKLGDEIDCYSLKVTTTGEIDLGEAELEEGMNVIKVKLTGKNDHATAYMFGLDYLKVEQ